jgi:hypothetical protein
MYSQAVYFFQQSVEKSTKAYGLVAGTIKPTHDGLLREVRYRSILAMMLRLPEMIEAFPKMSESLMKMLSPPALKFMEASGVFDHILKGSPGVKSSQVNEMISLIQGLKGSSYWRITLELPEEHPL